jgi:hypothetical protein
MPTLDQALQEAGKSGLRALTVWKLPDGRWQANTSPDGQAWTCVTDADLVAAVKGALGVKPAAAAPTGSIFE